MRTCAALVMLLVLTFNTSACDPSVSVTFEHALDETLRAGMPISDVPGQFRVGEGAYAVTLVPYRDGYMISLTTYFASVQEQISILSLTLVAPVKATVPMLPEPEWVSFEGQPSVKALGALRVGTLTGQLAESMRNADGPVALRMVMDVGGEERVVDVTLRRVVRRWWPPVR